MNDQEQQPLTRAEFNEQIGQLVQMFLSSGGRPEDVQEVLKHHSESAEYVQETIQRITRQQRASEQSENDGINPETIQEDSVQSVE